jgi:alginate O-acetyltransferase complex protein AlgI
MVFASLTFLFIFLPLCLITYYAFPQRQVRNVILIIFSLLFYAWGEPIWVCLLIISAIWDYFNGLWIGRHLDNPFLAKVGILSSLTVNLGLLVTFKYSDFIVQTVNSITGLNFTEPGFALPIGISFYTFQAISYTVGVYRREVEAQRNFVNFMVFVVSFHQLVAGPIVRYSHVVKEIEGRVFNLEDFNDGVGLFCRGLFKKVFIANTAGEISTQFLTRSLGETTVSGEWLGLIMYSLQIYFDFSGYSDMALGLGKMFGFHYRGNFNYPYISRSLTDFWRRWHISLGTFFRDYVYIPLGGNKQNATRNIIIVWALTGIWHGASWNFVLWGLYFAVILLLEKNILLVFLESLPNWIQHSYSIFLIVLGWAIFYFTDLNRLIDSYKILFGFANIPLYDYQVTAAISSNIYWLFIALALTTPYPSKLNYYFFQKLGRIHSQWLGMFENLVLISISVVFLVGKTYNPFIYFRF